MDPPAPQPIDEIRALDTDTLVSRMRVGVEWFDPRVFELGSDELERAWRPESGAGRWPIRVLLGHLADTEMLAATRIRTVFALDNPTLALFDEDAFVDSGIYGCTEGSPVVPPIGGDVATIHTLRCWLVATLFQLRDKDWARGGLHPERGPVTILDLARYACWHLEHHAWFLNAKAEKLLGPRPQPEPCPPEGCGNSGCACAGGGDGDAQAP